MNIVAPTRMINMSLPDRVDWYEKLLYLIMKDVVFLGTYNQEKESYDGYVHPFVLCNDTFAYACADGEELYANDIDTVTNIYDRFGWDGLIAMMAGKRQMKPLKELRTTEYYSALRALGLDDSEYKDIYE